MLARARAVFRACVPLALVMSLAACQTDRGSSAGPRSSRGAGHATAPATSLTGTLRGSAAAVGGETTGWRLIGDGATGGFDVDVSRVAARARSLDGRRVTVTGRMTTRNWPERGSTPVLVAETIEPAPEPGAK